jgi:DNA-binding transcriptional LysR family regulator
MDELEQAAAVARDAGKRPRGLLRVTAPISFSHHNLVLLLPKFFQRYPEVQLDLVLVDQVLDLVENGIDVALRLGRLANSSLVAHRLCGMSYVVCGSPAYFRQHGRPKTPHELAQHQCLRYPIPGVPARWRFGERDGSVIEVPVRGPVATANGIALAECATAGLGVVMLPRWNIGRQLHEGTLIQVLTEYTATLSEFEVAAWALYASREYLPMKVRVFVDFLKEHFRDGAPAEACLRGGARTTHRKSR